MYALGTAPLAFATLYVATCFLPHARPLASRHPLHSEFRAMWKQTVMKMERRSGRFLRSNVKFNGFAEQAFDGLHDRTLFHVLHAANSHYNLHYRENLPSIVSS
jgi:hypothetical protein